MTEKELQAEVERLRIEVAFGEKAQELATRLDVRLAAALRENAALREIVQQVAHHGEYVAYVCIFGGECEPLWNAVANDYDHAPDCFVTKARAILAENDEHTS